MPEEACSDAKSSLRRVSWPTLCAATFDRTRRLVGAHAVFGAHLGARLLGLGLEFGLGSGSGVRVRVRARVPPRRTPAWPRVRVRVRP